MNYSTVVFLINKNVRAVVATYEEHAGAKRTTFKTLDQTITPGDFIVVPTDTRHKMTVCKVVDVDIDLDFDQAEPVLWVIGKIDDEPYKQTLAQEATAITAVKSAELRQKRDDLRKAMFKDHMETLKALPISAMNGDTPPTPQE